MQRIDFYSEPHTEQRCMLFENAHKAGTINYEDDSAVKILIENLRTTINTIRQHAENESRWIHPFIVKNYEKEMISLDKDHHELEALLDELEQSIESLEKALDDRATLGKKMYQSLYRFIGRYVNHMEQEESLLPSLWSTFKDAELAVVIAAFLTARHPNNAPGFLKNLKENFTQSDTKTFFEIIQNIYPPIEYEQIAQIYGRV